MNAAGDPGHIGVGVGSGERITYVLDTSVLLSDPRAAERFEEHRVVVPLVVLTELEGKRHHPELGWAARTGLRWFEARRVEHGSLTEQFVVNGAGGTLEVAMRDTVAALPDVFHTAAADHRLLAVASQLHGAAHRVVVVSKDLPLRLMASVCGLEAEEYRWESVPDSGWTGVAELDVASEVIDRLYSQRRIELPEHTFRCDDREMVPVNTGLILHAGSQSAVARVTQRTRTGTLTVAVVDPGIAMYGVRPRGAEQMIAADMLLDPEVGIVSLGGPAGTGKSLLALAGALEAVDRNQASKVIVFRPLLPVGGQELGFLPGDAGEKLAPWSQAVWDTLEAFCSDNVLDHLHDRRIVDVLPITHIRGRTISGAIVIVDESQNFEITSLLSLLTRIGPGSRVVLTHDVAQRDNLRVSRHDGITAVVERLKGDALFGHVALNRVERSPIAALAARLLDTGN